MTTWYYGRVSTDHQENSAENQRQLFEGLAAAGNEDFHVLIDDNVPGSTPLSERPCGKKLWDGMREGDTVVVMKLDRGWRSMEDAVRSLNVMRRLGVRLRILDFPVDVSTDEGELMFIQFAGWAQYDNRLRGRRVRDVNSYRRRNGLPVGRVRPFGWLRSGDTFKPLMAEREIADRMHAMREQGMSYEKIGWKLAAEGVKRPTAKGGKIRPYYGKEQIRNLLKARAAGYPKVAQALMRDYERDGTPSSRAEHALPTES
jgi:DNA invertase Pin-like site-specific DNA recombinase